MKYELEELKRFALERLAQLEDDSGAVVLDNELISFNEKVNELTDLIKTRPRQEAKLYRGVILNFVFFVNVMRMVITPDKTLMFLLVGYKSLKENIEVLLDLLQSPGLEDTIENLAPSCIEEELTMSDQEKLVPVDNAEYLTKLQTNIQELSGQLRAIEVLLGLPGEESTVKWDTLDHVVNDTVELIDHSPLSLRVRQVYHALKGNHTELTLNIASDVLNMLMRATLYVTKETLDLESKERGRNWIMSGSFEIQT